jgi:hypothetical protein
VQRLGSVGASANGRGAGSAIACRSAPAGQTSASAPLAADAPVDVFDDRPAAEAVRRARDRARVAVERLEVRRGQRRAREARVHRRELLGDPGHALQQPPQLVFLRRHGLGHPHLCGVRGGRGLLVRRGLRGRQRPQPRRVVRE